MTMVVDAWDANFGRIHSGDAKSAKKEGAPLQPAGSMDPEIHLEAIFATKDSGGKAILSLPALIPSIRRSSKSE